MCQTFSRQNLQTFMSMAKKGLITPAKRERVEQHIGRHKTKHEQEYFLGQTQGVTSWHYRAPEILLQEGL